MSQTPHHPHRPPGRPREFDIDAALDKAVRVFRERGYHATSIGDLSDAMELAAGSIYKAFKDKRAVFLAAFDRYSALRSAQVRAAADDGQTGHDRLRRVLASYLEASQGIEGRRGCLVVGSTIELAALDAEVAARVSVALKANEALLAGLIREGQADGSIPAHVDPDATARLMICMTQGMRVVGKAKTPLPTAALLDVAMKLIA
ncbi:TetR/AcrR family transcriptional regulator [Bradyrhizobium sp. 2TAF24]|uniref:TetR/AcrR family transcriptional regulator n=1 Tax=Bradyrhizobium sp. 2TAF24 TaxID=3233011 RepID=UPI003F9330BC